MVGCHSPMPAQCILPSCTKSGASIQVESGKFVPLCEAHQALGHSFLKECSRQPPPVSLGFIPVYGAILEAYLHRIQRQDPSLRLITLTCALAGRVENLETALSSAIALVQQVATGADTLLQTRIAALEAVLGNQAPVSVAPRCEDLGTG